MNIFGNMNIFRNAGDLIHLSAFILLILKICTARSVKGISGKTQVLLALVFTTRYLDIFTNFVSIYNTSFKIIFILLAYGTLYLIFIKFKSTYDKANDKFRIEILLILVALIAMLCNYEFTALEVTWAFSIVLEAVAILPQMSMLVVTVQADRVMKCYLFLLASYRGLYILNWIYRYNEEGFYDGIAVTAGCIQTALYTACFAIALVPGHTAAALAYCRRKIDQEAEAGRIHAHAVIALRYLGLVCGISETESESLMEESSCEKKSGIFTVQGEENTEPGPLIHKSAPDISTCA